MRLTKSRRVAWTTAVPLLLSATAAIAGAQGSLSGTVTAAGSGIPLPESRVIVVGTSLFASTGPDGKYRIARVPAGTAELRVLHVGYQEQKKSVRILEGQVATLDFSMANTVVQLDEVVTTATGEQRRAEVGNAVDNISISKLTETAPVRTIADVLNARVARRVRAAGNADGLRPAHSRARHQQREPVERADLHHRRRPDEQQQRLDDVRQRRQRLQPTRRHQPGGHREHRDREGTVGRDALRHRRGERRRRDHDQEGPRRRAALDRVRRRRHARRPQLVRQQLHVGRHESDHEGEADSLRPVHARHGLARDLREERRHARATTASACTARSRIRRSRRSATAIATPQGVQVSGGNDAIRYFLSGGRDDETGVFQLDPYEKHRFDSLGVTLHSWQVRPNSRLLNSFRAQHQRARSLRSSTPT